MNNIQKSIIGTSLMHTLFQEYKAGELAKSGELVRKRVAKYMKSRAKTNQKDFVNAIACSDSAWRTTVLHFAKENVRIEAKSTIRAAYNYFEEELSKYANIREEHIEKFLIVGTDDAEAEHNSQMVIDFLVECLGMEKKKSVLKTRLDIIKQNRILEGKDG